MVKVWLTAALCTAAFGGTITYDYTGNPFTSTFCANECPTGYTSDFITAYLTFGSPLPANFNAPNEASLGLNFISLSMSDQVPYVSTATGARIESLSLSTGSDGAIENYDIELDTGVPKTAGTSLLVASNPPFVSASGNLEADALEYSILIPGEFELGNSTPGSWTATLNDFAGGSAFNPTPLLTGDPVSGLNGTIVGEGAQDYYQFSWSGGAFMATASITGAAGGASYLFSAGLSGSCNAIADQTLNSSDGFAGTISQANLPAGNYCIGIDANNPNDPNFSLTFNTPVNGVAAAPEPPSFVLFSAALGVVGILLRTKPGRQS